MTTLLVAAAVGALLGAALGVFGGGGGILAVPMLVGLLGMDVDEAATASLVIVLFGALGGLVSHHRAGRVLWREGLAFGAASILGSAVGAMLASRVEDWIKLATFAALMVAAGLAMLRNARRQPRTRTVSEPRLVGVGRSAGEAAGDLLDWDPVADPGAALIDLPAADLPAAPRLFTPVAPPATTAPARRPRPPTAPAGYSVPLVLLLATGTGLVTGFLGVGGGFLVVPALVLSLRMPVVNATATGLVVIAVASVSSLVVRTLHSQALADPANVAVIVLATVAASLLAARFSGRLSPRTLGTGFAVLVLGMSLLVVSQAVVALRAAGVS